MARKVLLSFLGTNYYVRCNYYINNFRDENQKFIQLSILKMLQDRFSENDCAYIFLTEDARQRNWLSGNYIDSESKIANIGLEEALSTLKAESDLKSKIEPIDIPNGFTEEEVWKVFQKIYQLIEKEDELYLDITHAFRYFPMLCFALLNYARSLKAISVSAIYYGAFEKLGPAHRVKETRSEDRNAEILNLVAFDGLQQWTSASRMFIQTGNAEGLQKLAFERIRPLLQTNATRTPPTQALHLATKELMTLTKNIAVNRGKWLLEFDVEAKLLTPLKTYEEAGNHLIPAFQPLIEKIREDITPLANGPLPKWFASAQFCFEKGLYQQCFTQLQEGIKVEAVRRAPKTLQLNPLSELHQEIASQAFTIIQRELPKEEWAKTSRENSEHSIAIQNSSFVREIQPAYSSLEGLRNDINHGGYTQPSNAERLIKNLRNLLEKTRLVLENTSDSTEETVPTSVKKTSLFINHSNHPFTSWETSQRSAALEWGDVEDLPFPNVPPFATPEEVRVIADNNLLEIFRKAESHEVTIHIMGELTYTNYLVSRLLSAGIPCVASTTERSVTILKDGRKTSTFRFAAFRSY